MNIKEWADRESKLKDSWNRERERNMGWIKIYIITKFIVPIKRGKNESKIKKQSIYDENKIDINKYILIWIM